MRTIQESVEAVDAVLKQHNGTRGYSDSPFLSGGIFTCTYDCRSDTTYARVRIYRNGFGFSLRGMHRAELFDKLSRKVEAYGKLYQVRVDAAEAISNARAELSTLDLGLTTYLWWLCFSCTKEVLSYEIRNCLEGTKRRES